MKKDLHLALGLVLPATTLHPALADDFAIQSFDSNGRVT